ncbi:MAG: helix-turn-helix transcriptional regulator, partial [Chloroflexota bacterium]
GVFEVGWHKHLCHQLIYAESGVIHIRTENKQLLLPAHHGVWIPAECAHSLYSSSSALKICSVYFQPKQDDGYFLQAVRVFPLSTLAHEMLVYSHRWLKVGGADPLKTSFFQTLRLLVNEWCEQSLSLELPLPQEPMMIKVTEFILDRLDQSLNLDRISNQFNVSKRTLMRYFQSDLGMTFGRYVQVARIARAAELLTHPAATVTDVALAAGYRSPSSFTQAFQLLVGQTPSGYLRGRKGLRE